MAKDEEARPFLSQYRDSRGKMRWRFRREGKTISLRGEPGEPEFEERYRAAVQGREPQIADVVRIPGAARPRSFGAAWNLVTKSAEWKAYDTATVHKNRRLSEMFLKSKVVPDADVIWRDVLVSDFKRRHAKTILSDNADKPHHAKHMLVAIRRMIRAALDEEWIEIDPTYGIKWAPKHVGWRAWTDDEMEKFEKRWPLGSTPRLVYALGLWLGHRRSDLVRLKWTDVKEHTVELAQTQKTDRKMVLPITPMLREALDAAEKKGDTILFTQYGRPFSDKGITVRMRVWTKAAGLDEGCTLHGLRKTLGRMLAESGASTRELMEVLGHDDIDHAELYSRDAEKALLAREGMAKVVQFRKKGS